MASRQLRAIALVASYNEERFISGCIEHLREQGVEVYLIDNGSSDETVVRAERYLGQGLIAIEALPRDGAFPLGAVLERKEALAAELDADWFMHHDADEIRTACRSDLRLIDALERADQAGFNAVNFLEFSFIPTLEAPDHDHPAFRETMRHYYPFLPAYPHRLNAWKRQPEPVDLRSAGGHRVAFPALRADPTSLRLRHYMFLSPDHALEKYSGRHHAAPDRQHGWGGWRNVVADVGARRLAPPLPPQSQLREYAGEDELDPSQPVTEHPWAEAWARAVARAGGGADPHSTSAV